MTCYEIKSYNGEARCASPRYSIVMAMFNAEKTLAKAIASVQAQTLCDWELVVVDDGSTDSSFDLLQGYAQDDMRIKPFRQQNSGPGAARSLALKNCVGEYVAFLDSDDYWETDFLESVEAVASIESSDVLFIERIYEREDGSYVGKSSVSRNKGLTKNRIVRRQMTGLIPWGMGKVFRRSLLDKTRAGFSNLEVGEEAIFSFEIISAAQSISFVEKPIYHYVKRPDGQHKKGGLDPWFPVVRAMSAHLDTVGELDQYQATINSFALRSLCVAVYRIACSTTREDSPSRLISHKRKQYEADFDFRNIDDDSVDRKSKAILLLLRLGLCGAIIAASRARKRRLAY